MERRYIVKQPFAATRTDTGGRGQFEPGDQLWWDAEECSDPVVFTLYDKYKFRVDDGIEFTQTLEPAKADNWPSKAGLSS